MDQFSQKVKFINEKIPASKNSYRAMSSIMEFGGSTRDSLVLQSSHFESIMDSSRPQSIHYMPDSC